MTEEQWKKVKDLLPPEKPKHGGRPGKDNWMMLNGILYWLNTGIPWRDRPERYSPWKSVYTRSASKIFAAIPSVRWTASLQSARVPSVIKYLDWHTIRIHGQMYFGVEPPFVLVIS